MNDWNTNLKTLITRRPLAGFLILAFALALIPFAALHLLAPQLALLRALIAGLAPLLAALIVTAAMDGGTGVRRLLGGFLQWRFGAGFYCIALMLPCLILLGAWLGVTLFGAEADVITLEPPDLALIALLVLLRGPLGEEAGFRGFALPLLMRRYSLIPASLMTGGLSAFWRLPLLVLAGLSLFPGDPARFGLLLAGMSLGTIALGIPLGWLYVKTESLVAPVLMRLGVGLAALLLIAPEAMKALSFAASITLIAALWAGSMRLPLPAAAAARPPLSAGPLLAFQAVALMSLLPWFFFYVLFNTNKPVAARDSAILIYFLFGTLWQVPLFLGLVSAGMWGAFVLRFKRAAYAAGAVLCLPLLAFAFILLMQYLDYQAIRHR